MGTHIFLRVGKKGKISLDSFLRLNVRLDNTINEIQEALENLTDEEVQEYYRKEFREIAGEYMNIILNQWFQS